MSLNQHMYLEQLITEDALDDQRQLGKAYAAWVENILRSPLWSLKQSDGKRIPWHAAEIARKHSSIQAAFALPGLYLFGSAAGIPRYLGMTKQTLWERLSGRYLRGEGCQCQLAVTYGDELRRNGINGFAQSIRKDFKTSTVRLEGAADFARHGIDGIWVALFPVHNKEVIRLLEARLIPIANDWNISRGYEPHINKQLHVGHSRGTRKRSQSGS